MARILLADDEEALRLILGRQLRRSGHDVTLAEDGLVALEMLNSATFDVVVSDMKMPRLDGMGLLARSAVIAPDTEFIILTGHGSLESAVDAFKTGHVFDYLLKPLEDINQLDNVVKRAVERHNLRAENLQLVSTLKLQVEYLEEARTQLEFYADRDGLTNLYNHKAIHRILEEQLNALHSDKLAILMIDMDDFKLINDTFGHLSGDHALRHLSAALISGCPENAFIGRCGGDEFMIILAGMTAEQAKIVAEDVRELLSRNPFIAPDKSRLPFALSVGIADLQTAGRSASALVSAGDAALYKGKQSGGNRVCLHMTPEIDRDGVSSNGFDVLDGLVTAIDHKDNYTKRHSEDVTSYALKIADALGLSSETLHAVRVAGLLHDIGKIGIPDFILRKPGKLTPGEYEVMKGHVTLSSLIIHGLPHMHDILDAVSNHHERWDGKGYPRGIAGKEIPLLGRVMAVADAFSAMTLSRPYRPAMPIVDALAEIELGSGTQFDPELVEVFVREMRSTDAESDSRVRRAA